MQKLRNFLLISALMVITITVATIALSKPKTSENMAFPEFIIGTWRIQESQPTSDYLITELDFVDVDTLIADIEYSEGAYYNVIFRYKFIEQNRIEIAGRSGDEWQIERRGDLLFIDTNSWPENRLFIYRRENPINWPLVTLAIGFVTITSYLTALFAIKEDIVNTSVKDTWKLKNVPRYLVYIVTIILGVAVGLIIWSWPPLLRIRLPWDSIIMLELSLFMLAVSLVINKTKSFLLKLSESFVETWLPILGFFLIGFSLCGLGISLLRLTVFLMSESYLV